MYWSFFKVNVKQLNVILDPHLLINLKSILLYDFDMRFTHN